MPIPETQLDTWAKQGSGPGSRDTYATIKRTLEAPGSKYAAKSFEIFLQGSYCNDTNIYAESAVDVVIRLDSTFYYDTSKLTTTETSNFDAAYPGTALYGWHNFKR